MIAAIFAVWLHPSVTKLTPIDVRAMYTYAKQYDVPVSIAESLMMQESGGDPYAVHHNRYSTDMGLYQVNSRTWTWLCKRFNRGVITWPYDPVENTKMALRYLSALYTVTESWRTAIEAYNAGLRATLNHDQPISTVYYARDILSRAEM